MAIAFKPGQRFKVKGDIEKTVYVFEKVAFSEWRSEIYCIDPEGNSIILEETSLSDLSHIS